MLSNLIPASSHGIFKVTFKLPVLPDSIPSYTWSQWSIQLLSVFLTEPGDLLAVLVCPCSVLEKYVTCSQGEASINAAAAVPGSCQERSFAIQPGFSGSLDRNGGTDIAGSE